MSIGTGLFFLGLFYLLATFGPYALAYFFPGRRDLRSEFDAFRERVEKIFRDNDIEPL